MFARFVLQPRPTAGEEPLFDDDYAR